MQFKQVPEGTRQRIFLCRDSVLTRSFDFGATIEILEDVNLALEEGEKQGVPQSVSQQANDAVSDTQGLAADLSELVKLVEEWGNVEIK